MGARTWFAYLLALSNRPEMRSYKKEKMKPRSSPAHNTRPVGSNSRANTAPITLLKPPWNTQHAHSGVKTLSQSPCTALMAGNLCAISGSARDCQWSLWEFLPVTGYIMNCSLPKMHWTCRDPQSIFRLANKHKQWQQLITGHVAHPIDSPAATMLGLCSSL